jgi:hypothetical protein
MLLSNTFSASINKGFSKKKPLLIPFETSNYLRLLGMDITEVYKLKKN